MSSFVKIYDSRTKLSYPCALELMKKLNENEKNN